MPNIYQSKRLRELEAEEMPDPRAAAKLAAIDGLRVKLSRPESPAESDRQRSEADRLDRAAKTRENPPEDAPEDDPFKKLRKSAR